MDLWGERLHVGALGGDFLGREREPTRAAARCPEFSPERLSPVALVPIGAWSRTDEHGPRVT